MIDDVIASFAKFPIEIYMVAAADLADAAFLFYYFFLSFQFELSYCILRTRKLRDLQLLISKGLEGKPLRN